MILAAGIALNILGGFLVILGCFFIFVDRSIRSGLLCLGLSLLPFYFVVALARCVARVNCG